MKTLHKQETGFALSGGGTSATGLPSKVDPHKWQAILSIDLSMIERKLVHEMGKGWSPLAAKTGVEKYRKWLYLVTLKPKHLVPSEFIDEVWHCHILDTRAYGPDCDKAFGFFLHHFPYFGLRGDEDLRNLEAAYAATKALFREVWEEEMCEAPADGEIPGVYSICNGGICDPGSGCQVTTAQMAVA